MVSKNGLVTCEIFLFMFIDDYIPPLDIEIEDIISREEEGEEVNSSLVVIKAKLGVEAMDDKEEEFKSLMKPYFNDMSKNIMQGL